MTEWSATEESRRGTKGGMQCAALPGEGMVFDDPVTHDGMIFIMTIMLGGSWHSFARLRLCALQFDLPCLYKHRGKSAFLRHYHGRGHDLPPMAVTAPRLKDPGGYLAVAAQTSGTGGRQQKWAGR